jgi:exonuclease VII large subunit
MGCDVSPTPTNLAKNTLELDLDRHTDTKNDTVQLNKHGRTTMKRALADLDQLERSLMRRHEGTPVGEHSFLLEEMNSLLEQTAKQTAQLTRIRAQAERVATPDELDAIDELPSFAGVQRDYTKPLVYDFYYKLRDSPVG